jgi:hypothetical protein
VLEDPDAFRPRARLRAGAYAGDQAGRPLLPAALATERMVEELLGWAALMPPYATHLTGKSVCSSVPGPCTGVWRCALGPLGGPVGLEPGPCLKCSLGLGWLDWSALRAFWGDGSLIVCVRCLPVHDASAACIGLPLIARPRAAR